jgi:hypothetical protein
MDKSIPTPWVVAAIVAVLVIVGVVVWRHQNPGPPVSTGPINPYNEYRGSPGGPYGPPAGVPAGSPPGGPAGAPR